MKAIRNVSGIFIILILLFSCYDETDDKASKQETPKALQEDPLEIKSYSRSGDLVEELYQELTDKTPALKELEEAIHSFSPKTGVISEKFNEYDRKSNSYYGSSEYKASAISDSLLKRKIISLITESKSKYSVMNAELISLLKEISKNGARIHDSHTALKIVLTLPMIEKYQNDNLPDKKEFREFINEQRKLIEQIDSLTPNY